MSTTTTPRHYFEATTYRLVHPETTAAPWVAFKTGTGTDRADAIRQATAYLPMGWGGHARSERSLQAIRAGETVATPLGTYRIEVDEVRVYTPAELNIDPNAFGAGAAAAKVSELIHRARKTGEVFGEDYPPATAAKAIAQHAAGMFPTADVDQPLAHTAIYRALIGAADVEDEGAEQLAINRVADRAELVEGIRGWGILREPVGLSCQYWVELGRALYGPFGDLTAAADELAAEEAATAPDPEPDVFDFPTYTGYYGFRSPGAVKLGDAVAVTFTDRRTPIFGYVERIGAAGVVATVRDVEYGRRSFATEAVATVAVLPGRKGLSR